MKGLPSVGVFLLLFLTSTALSAMLPSLYIAEDHENVLYDRRPKIYEKRSHPRLHYKTLTRPYRFLYQEPDHPDTWTIGEGANFSNVKPFLRSPASAGKPPSTHWRHLRQFREFHLLKFVEVKNIGADELNKKLEM